jgi:hypothetical protein
VFHAGDVASVLSFSSGVSTLTWVQAPDPNGHSGATAQISIGGNGTIDDKITFVGVSGQQAQAWAQTNGTFHNGSNSSPMLSLHGKPHEPTAAQPAAAWGVEGGPYPGHVNQRRGSLARALTVRCVCCGCGPDRPCACRRRARLACRPHGERRPVVPPNAFARVLLQSLPAPWRLGTFAKQRSPIA